MRSPLLPGFKGAPKDVRVKRTLRNNRNRVMGAIAARQRLQRKAHLIRKAKRPKRRLPDLSRLVAKWGGQSGH